jgi:transcriptional regulator with XRE-family HTH domain
MLIRKTKSIKINFRKTVKEIARFCDVGTNTVYNWKNGKAFPNPTNLAKLRELEELSKKK